MFMNVRKLILAGAASLLVVACAQEKKEGYVIEGEIAGIQTGTIYLKCYRNGAFEEVDSAAIENGKFRFKGTSDEPLAYALTTVKENKRPQVFFLSNESVQVKLDEMQKQLQVSGSPEQDLYAQYEGRVSEDAALMDSLFARHSDSPVSAYLFVRNLLSRLDYASVKAYRDRLDASLEGTEYVRQIDAQLALLSRLQVGAEAPDFTLPDAEGNDVRLSSFRGKYVLIDFWASWCPDCRKENPVIVKAWNQFKNKNFTILGVSLDRKKEPWLQAIEKDGLTWTHVCDFKDWNSDVAKMYAVKWIPKSFLLDPEGKIVASGLEGDALLDKLQEVLK